MVFFYFFSHFYNITCSGRGKNKNARGTREKWRVQKEIHNTHTMWAILSERNKGKSPL
jgi:hypothetical protein